MCGDWSVMSQDSSCLCVSRAGWVVVTSDWISWEVRTQHSTTQYLRYGVTNYPTTYYGGDGGGPPAGADHPAAEADEHY